MKFIELTFFGSFLVFCCFLEVLFLHIKLSF